MGVDKIEAIFENFLKTGSIFNDKSTLQPNYLPENIIHRENQINLIAGILAPTLRSNKPSNLFVYGKTGTGKTLSIKHTTNKLEEMAIKNGVGLKVLYVNCKLKKIADTEYRLVAHLARQFGKAIPATGLPTDEVYRIFFDVVDKTNHILLIILDEIDQLVKKTGDEILYNLTRINSDLKTAQVAVVGISNDVVFTDGLDPRVKSSLSEEEIVFPPYNALQIKDILTERAAKAFRDNAVSPGVIEKCAAFAAREHGDARRALELLRVAGELAERSNETNVKMEHLDLAEEKIERDRVLDIVTVQPKQFQATLYSILTIYSQTKEVIFTGQIYEVYKKLCNGLNLRPLTQRRVSDILAELDMLGIINAKVTSKGRYGRTREISLAVQPHIESRLLQILKKELDLC